MQLNAKPTKVSLILKFLSFRELIKIIGLPGRTKKAAATKQTTLFGLAPGSSSTKSARTGMKGSTAENSEVTESQETEADMAIDDDALNSTENTLVSEVMKSVGGTEVNSQVETQEEVGCFLVGLLVIKSDDLHRHRLMMKSLSIGRHRPRPYRKRLQQRRDISIVDHEPFNIGFLYIICNSCIDISHNFILYPITMSIQSLRTTPS